MTKISTTIGIVCCMLTLQLLPTETAYAGNDWKWRCDKQNLTSFWEQDVGFNELSGRGTVCATPLGLWSTLAVKGLTPGNAYTVWWVYVDDPGACANFPITTEINPDIPADEPHGYADRCGLADFFTPDPVEVDEEGNPILNPLAVFGRMDSVVAGNRKRTRFAGDLRDFRPSPGSQVWMFIFGHGPADTSDKRQLARQLLTPEDPTSGIPHVGIQGRPFGYPAGVVVTKTR